MHGRVASRCAACLQRGAPLEFYDTWVARDMDGNPFAKAAPYARDPYSLERVKLGLPFPVKCCWNGLLVLNAKPISERGLRMRCAHAWLHGPSALGQMCLDAAGGAGLCRPPCGACGQQGGGLPPCWPLSWPTCRTGCTRRASALRQSAPCSATTSCALGSPTSLWTLACEWCVCGWKVEPAVWPGIGCRSRLCHAWALGRRGACLGMHTSRGQAACLPVPCERCAARTGRACCGFRGSRTACCKAYSAHAASHAQAYKVSDARDLYDDTLVKDVPALDWAAVSRAPQIDRTLSPLRPYYWCCGLKPGHNMIDFDKDCAWDNFMTPNYTVQPLVLGVRLPALHASLGMHSLRALHWSGPRPGPLTG